MTHRFLASLGLLAAFLGGGCHGEANDDKNTGSGTGGAPPETEPPPEPENPVSCKLGLVAHEDGGDGAVELSNDGLTASSSGRVQIARAAASHAGGRWYYEVTVDSLIGGDFWAQNIGASVEGVISTVGDTAYMGALYNTTGVLSSGGDGSTRIGDGQDSAVQEDPFAAGDVIGVALDLDAGRVYFSKNGAWLGEMDPEAGKGGVEVLAVPGTGAYYPVLYLSDGDVMTANFGASAFAHDAPEGFSAFAEDLEEDESGDCVDEGPAGLPATPAPVEAACEDLTSYSADAEGETELHVIGIHERGEGGPKAAVHVSRTAPMVLALSSYAFTQWTVTVDPEAQLQQIVLVGHEPSRVNAPAGIPISTVIYNKDGSRIEAGHAWPNAPGGNDTPDLIRSVEEITGLTMTSFAGCLDGASFTVVDAE
ncbi:SPRY domain-containing protein [Sorangium sp. So ce1335]|uniref:SPRY domain-containing protein n=1 Tax=Sorangium sp. So ce1335 TaxID=3133335 RepID=UPI003F626198